jgi:hypothetical protein
LEPDKSCVQFQVVQCGFVFYALDAHRMCFSFTGQDWDTVLTLLDSTLEAFLVQHDLTAGAPTVLFDDGPVDEGAQPDTTPSLSVVAVAPTRGEIGEQLARFSYRAPESSGRVQSIPAKRAMSGTAQTPELRSRASLPTEALRLSVRKEVCLACVLDAREK